MEQTTIPADADTLPQATRRVHRALLDDLLRDGGVVAADRLARRTAFAQAEAADRLRELVAADYAAVDASGRLTCLYPFSVAPTPHVVVLDGRRHFAMCAIDALGIPAMLGQEFAIESGCAVCGAQIRLKVAPGTLASIEPPETLVVARSEAEQPACEACCPFTVFACGQAHAQTLLARTPGTHVLPPREAQIHGERIFGDLLAEVLPATRRRSRLATAT